MHLEWYVEVKNYLQMNPAAAKSLGLGAPFGPGFQFWNVFNRADSSCMCRRSIARVEPKDPLFDRTGHMRLLVEGRPLVTDESIVAAARMWNSFVADSEDNSHLEASQGCIKRWQECHLNFVKYWETVNVVIRRLRQRRQMSKLTVPIPATEWHLKNYFPSLCTSYLKRDLGMTSPKKKILLS